MDRVFEIADAKARAELPEKNKTSGKKTYTAYYSWSARMLAEDMFATEMEAFGYDFEGRVGKKAVVSLINEYKP